MVEIIPMSEEDGAAVRALELFCIKEYVEVAIKKRWEDLSPELRDKLGASAEPSFSFYLTTGLSLVAKENGQVVGFIFAQMVHHINNTPLAVWVENIGVHPEHRRKGIGYHLLRKVAEMGKEMGATIVHSSISLENTRSIMMHKKLGFLTDTRKIAILDLSTLR